MKKLDHLLDTYETASFVLLLSAMTFVVFIQVICRYILQASLPWSEEVSRYCMIYTVFIGVGAGLKAGTHTGVDALITVLPSFIRWWVIMIEKVLCFALSAVFLVLSTEVVVKLFQSGQKSATLFIPIAFAYFAMPLGFLGGTVRSLQNIIIHIKEGRR
ncbi:MAG: TRAP transporter small permease [Lachnoclostridium edouardi]|uniref:TRAP transporter small permease n=1 Tax=Lachnoclostridium edouardi TaxID=1926283 RepID=UPI0026DDA622|nr:TRAP transporter small permease [Lachnoclostridium edouardi]MDO4279865.1 TRAP transporter small permease [Lachnoclostridium edouardi]